MDHCHVLIVGGGPAGSACAWALSHCGVDVIILDKAKFPRDKVCAGWITPAVLDELKIDSSEYSQGRVLQPITGFLTGIRIVAVKFSFTSIGLHRLHCVLFSGVLWRTVAVN